MSTIPPTYSFTPARPAPPSAQMPPATPAPASPPNGAPAVERAAASVDSVEISGAKRLVAARVPDQVDFVAPSASRVGPSPSAMPIYHHPADMNAAATGIELGNRLDVTG